MKVQDPDGEWRSYPPSFSEQDKLHLESFIGEHSRTCCMRDLETITSNDVVCIRHDVDHSLDHALKFARWETDRGIHSTYFVLHTAYYYRDKDKLYAQMRQLVDYGHEVGLHLDTVNQSAIDGEPDYHAAADLLWAELDLLRNAGFDIIGSAAHGGIRTDLELFDNMYELSDFDLQYEAYELQRRLRANYISDNRGLWQNPLIKTYEVTIMSIHPEHWPFK